VKTYAHECIACDGEGTVEEIDHARTRSYSEQPEWKTTVCDCCHGDGEVTLDETAHAFVCAMVDDYQARRVTDKAIMAEQRQQYRANDRGMER
jgi:RecJ-like exonuclease